jgi:hypothetical protein
MAKNPGVDTITVIRKAKVDRLSSAPAGTPPEHDVTGCAILPRTSFEQGKGWVIVEGRQVIAPYGADVLATDQVRVEGLVWEVDGEPGRYSKRGKGKACIFYLTRVT